MDQLFGPSQPTTDLIPDDNGRPATLPTLKVLDVQQTARAIGKLGRLSAREITIVAHLLLGLDTDTIAASTDLSNRGVKFHVGNILRKLHIESRTELIRFLF